MILTDVAPPTATPRWRGGYYGWGGGWGWGGYGNYGWYGGSS